MLTFLRKKNSIGRKAKLFF